MTENPGSQPASQPPGERLRRFRGPLLFGVVAATLEMAAILWFMYC